MSKQYLVEKFSKDEDKGTVMLNDVASKGYELKFLFEAGSGFVGIFEKDFVRPMQVNTPAQPEEKKRGPGRPKKEEVTVTETQLPLPTGE